MLYILGETMPKLTFCGASSGLRHCKDRTLLVIETEERYEPYLRDFIVEKIAEVICIAYKYEMLNEFVVTANLTPSEREILLAELIAADLPDDVAYVSELLSGDEIYQLDGFFSFRLNSLKEKWRRISDSIPVTFRKEQLYDFIEFIIEDNRGTLYLKGGEVFNDSYQKLHRAGLIANDELALIREIILSGARDVLCLSDLPETECAFLQKYYGERVIFA